MKPIQELSYPYERCNYAFKDGTTYIEINNRQMNISFHKKIILIDGFKFKVEEFNGLKDLLLVASNAIKLFTELEKLWNSSDWGVPNRENYIETINKFLFDCSFSDMIK